MLFDLADITHRKPEELRKELSLIGAFSERTHCAQSQRKRGAVDTLYVAKPALMTGAGDNFDAGIAAALLIGGDHKQTFTIGTLVCSHYIELGESASPDSLLRYYNDRKKNR